jgi:hypothetical protein
MAAGLSAALNLRRLINLGLTRTSDGTRALAVRATVVSERPMAVGRRRPG